MKRRLGFSAALAGKPASPVTHSTDDMSARIRRSGPIDKRIYFHEDRLTRRFDSLARLFNLADTWSACTSVAIYEDELIISANCASEDKLFDVVSMLQAKLKLLRDTLNDVRVDPNLIHTPLFFETVVQHLKQAGDTAIPEGVLMQALYKIICSCVSDSSEEDNTQDCFSSTERDALLTSPKVSILVPATVTQKKQPKVVMAVFNGTNSLSDFPYCDFPGKNSSHKVQHVHAEQMIAYYLQQVRGVDLLAEEGSIIRLGVSKLCCDTCANLSHLNRVYVRGSSQLTYHRTLNLFESSSHVVQQPPATPPQPSKKRITHAESSPWSPLLLAAPMNARKKQQAVAYTTSVDTDDTLNGEMSNP